MPRLTVPLIAATLIFVSAAPSQALTYCVAPEASCSAGQTYPTVQEALDQAASTPAADKVQLGAATYTTNAAGGFSYAVSSPLELAGKGAATVITRSPSSTYALTIDGGPGSSIHDLKIHLPADVAAGSAALLSQVDVTRITVDEDATQSNGHSLVILGTDADLSHATLTADASGAINTVGIFGGTGSKLTDVTVTAKSGIRTNGSGLVVDGATITAAGTGMELDYPASVSNCRVHNSVEGASTGIVVYSTGVSISNCTLVGLGSVSDLMGISVSGVFQDASATVNNTLVRSYGHSLFVDGAAHSASLGIAYSDFDPSADTVVNGGTLTPGTGVGFHADVKVLDEAGGNFRPRYDSPLVDAGDPASTGATDLQNFQRVVDGNGDGAARVDIGAYEYPRQGPEPQIDDGPTAGDANVEYSWSGSATDPDPGETPLLTYGWKVDGGPLEPGATLKHTFTNGGTHQLQFVATDPTGAVATIDYPVDITAPPPPPAGTPDPPTGGTPPTGTPDPPTGGTPPTGSTPPTGTTTQPTHCVKPLRFRTTLDRRLRTATARLAGKRLRVRRAQGRLVVRVDLRHRKPGVYRLRIAGRTASGKRLARTRRYRVCG